MEDDLEGFHLVRHKGIVFTSKKFDPERSQVKMILTIKDEMWQPLFNHDHRWNTDAKTFTEVGGDQTIESLFFFVK